MKQFACKPTIHMFPTCKDFLAGFDIGEEDLVLSHAYIFKPFFDGLDCRAKALFLEDYGQGEPSDTMVDALLAAASRYDFRRIPAEIMAAALEDIAQKDGFLLDHDAADILAQHRSVPGRQPVAQYNEQNTENDRYNNADYQIHSRQENPLEHQQSACRYSALCYR